MKNDVRRFTPGVINHCYQNTVGGGLIFYSVSDCLVMFTIMCTLSIYYNVRILALCFMPDHLHDSCIANDRESLSAFIGHSTSAFARQFNQYTGRSGPLFNSPFGSAPKEGSKKGRTNLIYVYNNPVERHLVSRAELFRWNFLAYAENSHPFSEPLIIRRASKKLLRALKMVEYMNNKHTPLTYPLLNSWFFQLDKTERNQLTDYIITKYSTICHDEAINYFGSYDKLLTAVHSTTGNEYDINEVFVGRRDDVYNRMSATILERGLVKDIQEVITLPYNQKQRLYKELLAGTDATAIQIKKYLHMRYD